MKCWSCNHELIWGGNHDTEWEENDEEEHMVVTNLSCPECTAVVIVYHCNVENRVMLETEEKIVLDNGLCIDK